MLIIGWIVFGLGELSFVAAIRTGASSKRTYPESEESHEASAIFAFLAIILLVAGALMIYTAQHAVDIAQSSVAR